MELGLEIARLVVDSRGATPCTEQVLQRFREIIQSGSPLSIHTFLVHRHCQQKFSQCASAILLEVWTVAVVWNGNSQEKVLDALFLKNAVRSHLHFSQLSSWMASNGGQLPNDTACEYRISLDGSVGLGDQLSNVEIHKFPVGRLDPALHVYVTVRWRKYDVAPRLLQCSESTGSVTDEWLLSPQSLSSRSHAVPRITLTDMPHFYVPVEYQQNDEEGNMEVENDVKDSTSQEASKTSKELRTTSSEQLLSRGNQDTVNASRHIACKPPHVHSDPRICQFFNFQKSVKAEDDTILTENEQVVGSPVIESLSDFLSTTESSSTNLGSPLQATAISTASRRETLPRRSLIASAFRFMSTATKAFSKTTGLPLNSSPAPFSRNETKTAEKQPPEDTEYGSNAEKTATAETRADLLRSISGSAEDSGASDNESICTRRSASSSSGLLCNFEESALNGRLEPVASLDGFRLQIAANGATSSPHLTLPVTTFFFNMPEDEAPLPYLGLCSLEYMHKGYRIPKKGNLQAVLFNPQGTVVRMFLVKFDVSDMPPSSQTFLRQRTFFMPVGCTDDSVHRSWLKYLIHLSLATDRRGRLYMHTDIRMLFSQKNDLEALNLELGKDLDKYELRSFTEMPRNPKYSSRK